MFEVLGSSGYAPKTSMHERIQDLGLPLLISTVFSQALQETRLCRHTVLQVSFLLGTFDLDSSGMFQSQWLSTLYC